MTEMGDYGGSGPVGDRRGKDLLEALLADDLDEKPCCTLAVAWRPKRWLGRYRHRLWICACGQAWRTKRGRYEKVTWLWRRWSA